MLPGVIDIAYEQYKSNLPLYRLTEDLMTRQVITISPEATLDEAAHIMGQKHVGSLIVEKYKTAVGIVTERDLLSKVIAYGILLSDQKVEDVMSYPLTGVSVQTNIKKVAKMMTSHKGRLAVYDTGTLVGIITSADLIKSLPDVAETEAPINDFMSKKVVTADELASVINVAKMMGQQRIGSVIITRKNMPFGIFTERDLLTNFLAMGRDLFSDVGPNCSQPLIYIASGTSAHRAAALMALKHIRRLPIVEDEKIVGIITARDLVEAYAK
jgi:CBS domain-containing protein